MSARRSLFLLIGTLILAAPAVGQFKPLVLDLDGDGRQDTVRIVFDDPDAAGHYWRATIAVGRASVEVRGRALTGEVVPVDLDRHDSFVELLVPEDGDSDDYRTTVLRYRRRAFVTLGKIPGKPTGVGRFNLISNGAGTVRTLARSDLLHTWYRETIYRLVGEDLVEQPSEFYAMGRHPVTLALALPLQSSPTDSTIAGTLEPGDRAVLIASDNVRWVQIEREDAGLTGWFEVTDGTWVTAVDRGARDVFKGLVTAD